MSTINVGRSVLFFRHRRGFSLIELACVLAILAILLAGVMLLFGTTNNARKAKENVELLSDIVLASHVLCQGESAYTGLDAPTLAGSGLIPSRFVTGSGATAALVTAWDTPVTAGSNFPGNTGFPIFNVTFYNLSQTQCEAMAELNVQYGAHDMTINNTWYSNGSPPTVTAMLSSCVPGQSNLIGWNYL